MFLTQNNKIKWKLLGWATAATMALTAAGIAWFDKPLYMFMRRFDCLLWEYFDAVFDAKIWIFVSGFFVVLFYLEKHLNSNGSAKKETNKFNILDFFKDFLVKTKNSYAFFIFCSVLSASLFTKVAKVVIGRFRPIFFEALDLTGFRPFSIDWAFNSMPSGHATASFAGLVMLGMLAPRIKWGTWTLAILIGASRVAYGAHWPTDVLVGAFIGMVGADFVKAYLKSRRDA